jgi:FlaA1/EpsC-like NDP-sugar epimerase
LLKGDLDTYHDLLLEKIKGKRVLVVGGAGTIGASYLKAILKYQPDKVVVADINENALTELVRDCRSTPGLHIPPEFKTYPVNFGDPVFYKIFLGEGPFEIVANFAAHKHVRSEKDIFSIQAMIENNVIKAKKFLDLLIQHPPEHFFCVSTDKAANPVNIMGASKKLMEEVILAYSTKIKITTARFANVAFSNGSLLAGFIERVMKMQPLSCPSDVKRYFVSPEESGEICLIACLLGNSGEIIFPRLSHEKDLINFLDIARAFLEKIGFKPDICETEEVARKKSGRLALEGGEAYPLYTFSSGTSGEKLYEEFYTDNEELELDRFSALGVIKNAVRRDIQELDRIIIELEDFFASDTSKDGIVTLLNKLLPTFQHIEKGKNLDQQM